MEDRTFAKFGLHKWIVKQCRSLGIVQPTEVQEKCIPEILQGRDCLACDKTGSGKTAAFALPVLQKMSEDPFGIYCLILTPTRELAAQIADQMRALGKPINIRVCLVIGGVEWNVQNNDIGKKPHVVVATPGRLASLLDSGFDDFGRLKVLVLDEADHLLEDSFKEDLSKIFDNIPTARQTLVFSATITSRVEQARALAKNTAFVFISDSVTATVDQLDQKYIVIPELAKECYLIHLLREQASTKSVIVFTATCWYCQLLGALLKKFELPCAVLHSLMPQRNRNAALNLFKSGQLKIMVSTDVASRGLDIPQVELVINCNVPASPVDYIHRVGRTARAGRGGMALTLVTERDMDRLGAIESHIGTTLAEFEIADKEVHRLMKVVLISRREISLMMKNSAFGEKRKLNKHKKLLLEEEEKQQPCKKRNKTINRSAK